MSNQEVLENILKYTIESLLFYNNSLTILNKVIKILEGDGICKDITKS